MWINTFMRGMWPAQSSCWFECEQVLLVGQILVPWQAKNSITPNFFFEKHVASEYCPFFTWSLGKSLRLMNVNISLYFEWKYLQFYHPDYVASSLALFVHNWGLWIWQSRSLATDLWFYPSWWHSLRLPHIVRSSS